MKKLSPLAYACLALVLALAGTGAWGILEHRWRTQSDDALAAHGAEDQAKDIALAEAKNRALSAAKLAAKLQASYHPTKTPDAEAAPDPVFQAEGEWMLSVPKEWADRASACLETQASGLERLEKSDLAVIHEKRRGLIGKIAAPLCLGLGLWAGYEVGKKTR